MKQKSIKEQQSSTGTQKKSLRRGTYEDLKKMQQELDWSLEETLERTGANRGNEIRPPHFSTTPKD